METYASRELTRICVALEKPSTGGGTGKRALLLGGCCGCGVLDGQPRLLRHREQFFIRGNEDQGVSGPDQGIVHAQSRG